MVLNKHYVFNHSSVFDHKAYKLLKNKQIIRLERLDKEIESLDKLLSIAVPFY